MTRFLLALTFAIASVSTVVADEVEDRYNKTCMVCHAAGAAGAPKTGNAAEWEPRMAKGMDALVASVEKGMNAMPPKGMCFDCDAAQYAALIKYMATPK
jgi:cytochrome c5